MSHWESKPYVYCTIPVCPACGSASRTTTRSVRDPDGSVARRSRCRDCGQLYVLVLELPESGKTQGDARYDSARSRTMTKAIETL